MVLLITELQAIYKYTNSLRKRLFLPRKKSFEILYKRLMTMKSFFLVFAVIISSLSFGQSVSLVSPGEIPGIEILRFDSFTAQDLDRYMGNRAFLCREYGVQKMCVVDYTDHNDKARLEVFVMKDAPSAFGLYSVSNAGCLRWKLYSTFSCSGNSNILLAQGPFFFSINNLNKTGSGQNLCEQIAKLILSKNPQETWYIPPIFQHPKVVPFINSLTYMEGPVGVSNGAPQLTEILDNLVFKCYSIRIMAPAYAGLLSRIEFPDLTSISSFVIQAGLNTSATTTPAMSMNGAYRSWYKIDDTKLIYLECSSPDLKLTDIIPDRPNPMY